MDAIAIPLSDIILDPRLQCRASIDMELIDEYAENVMDLPPGKIVSVNGKYLLVDGWHTHGAHKKAGLTTMACVVTEGTYEDAIIAAAGANHGHGRRRTNDDKKRSVTMAMTEMPSKTDTEVARICRVSNHFVAKIRADLKPQVQSPQGKTARAEYSAQQKPRCSACARKHRVGQEVPTRCKDCDALRKPTKPAQPPEPDSEPEPLCARCKAVGVRVEGCTACQHIEENPPPPAPPPPDPVYDDAGTVVPVRLIPVFQARADYDKAMGLLTACAKAFKAIETGPTKDAKPLDPKAPYTRYFPVFKQARQKLKDLRPSLVCPKCDGEGADGCRCKGLGYLTKEMANGK